jgi:hypothetical protein
MDSGAIIAGLEGADTRPLVRTQPHAPIRPWKVNFLTSTFIMHSQHERNQTLLAAAYLDLLARQRALQVAGVSLPPLAAPITSPTLHHIDLPYIGSTEAFTNMRQSVEHKTALMARFEGLLKGQLDVFPFDQSANVIYGAGGFSGILAGLITTRAIEAGFAPKGGEIRQVYGVSDGVLNGFFHAVQIAARRHPDLYRPPAQTALADLESFIASIKSKKVARINYLPWRFWQGFANLAGWSMNTYIQPMPLNGQLYRDGGGTFYDIGIYTACLDANLTNMVNIHLDEPIGHSYNLPPRPNLVR